MNRLLRKIATAQGFAGDTERKITAYKDVREDLSTGSTYKSPAEVEFPKKSNKELSIVWGGHTVRQQTAHHAKIIFSCNKFIEWEY